MLRHGMSTQAGAMASDTAPVPPAGENPPSVPTATHERGNGPSAFTALASTTTGTRTGPRTGGAVPGRRPPFEWMQDGDVIECGWVVRVNFNRSGKVVRNSHLYAGKVAHVNAADGDKNESSSTYKIAYNDGDQEDSVQRGWIQWRRRVPAAEQLALANEGSAVFREGARVLGKCDEWQEFYAGTVTKVNRDGTYGVTFEDGDCRPFMQAAQLKVLPGAGGGGFGGGGMGSGGTGETRGRGGNG